MSKINDIFLFLQILIWKSVSYGIDPGKKMNILQQ